MLALRCVLVLAAAAVTVTACSASSIPAPTPDPEPVVFSGDGIHIVGRDLEPGVYKSWDVGADDYAWCGWARLSGTEDVESARIEIETDSVAPAYVTVQPGDVALRTRGCGDWRLDTK